MRAVGLLLRLRPAMKTRKGRIAVAVGILSALTGGATSVLYPEVFTVLCEVLGLFQEID